MDHEPFVQAVDQYARYVHSKGALMDAFEEETGIITWGVRMKAAQTEPNRVVSDGRCEVLADMRDEFEKLVKDSAHAVVELAPRAREARLKVIWREFVAEKKKLDC